MSRISLPTLNEQFAISDRVAFVAGRGDLALAEIRTPHANATVALQGGHIVSYQLPGQPAVLWVSRQSRYAAGQAIRGGVPVCWPWFGTHPSNPQLPGHGFARTALWTVRATSLQSDGAVQLRLGLSDNDATRAIWPHRFDLQITITVGPQLQATLITRNTDDTPITYSGALHSYFNVQDVAAISIDGLDGCSYIDKVAGGAQKQQAGPVRIDGEVDRLYLDTTATCTIDDPGFARRVLVSKQGSRSTVVWNPWAAKAQALSDFGDEEYHGMVCVETANAGPDSITLQPGETHRLSTTISVERS